MIRLESWAEAHERGFVAPLWVTAVWVALFGLAACLKTAPAPALPQSPRSESHIVFVNMTPANCIAFWSRPDGAIFLGPAYAGTATNFVVPGWALPSATEPPARAVCITPNARWSSGDVRLVPGERWTWQFPSEAPPMPASRWTPSSA